MKTTTKANESSLKEVALTELRPGMVVDRPLFVHLQKNGRHVCLVQEFHFLNQKLFKKLTSYGVVYSSREPGEKRYAKALSISNSIKQIVENEALSHFERNDAIFAALKPMVETVFKDTSTGAWDPTATESGLVVVEPMEVAYFFVKGLQMPSSEALEIFEDINFDGFQECLQNASVAAFLALLLGYSDLKFLRQYMSAVFLEAVSENLQAEQSQPVLKVLDHRFKEILFHIRTKVAVENKIGSYNDDLQDLFHYSKWLMHKSASVFNPTAQLGKIQEIPNCRVYKKLRTQFSRIFSVAMTKAALKEAA